VIRNDLRGRLNNRGGNFGSVLVDGFVGATWRSQVQRDAATLLIRPITPLSPTDEAAVCEEGARLLTFLTPNAPHDVQISDPWPLA
jgi:hypothetical protein